MNLRPRRREEPEINLVPMIDVVLVLLIFFMIATSLRHESELEIRLPEASGKPLPDNVARWKWISMPRAVTPSMASRGWNRWMRRP